MSAHEFNHRRERELIELWLLANEGQATSEQLDELSARLQNDAAARQSILAVSGHQGWLTWQGGPVPGMVATPCDDNPRKQLAAQRRVNPTPRRVPWIERVRAWTGSLRRVPLFSFRAMAILLPLLAAILLLLPNELRQIASTPDGELLDAHLVGDTLCVWDPSGIQRPGMDGRLREGDSLQLLEGIAELSLEHRSTIAKVVMEGPAAIVLARQAVPSLRYGKITVATDTPAQRFPVETPFGRVMLEPGTEIGVSAFGASAQVHVFAGVASVESPWLFSTDHEVVSKVVSAGEALIFDGVGDVALRVTQSVAHRDRFTPQVSMQSDFLAVDPEYVQEIRRAAPLAYWRFEGGRAGTNEVANLALNEMSDRFHGRLRGKVRWVGPEGNQAIEFGVRPEPGSFVVAESWDEVLDGDFTLEAWIKPSHYHLGSIMGFIGEFDWQDGRNKHGVLLEVGGTSQPSQIHQPERIRFLHRPTLGVVGGVSCFSDRPYQPRRWQHVVAVRQDDELRLYLDGALVATDKQAAPMTLGLQLVLGQLYSETVERFFIGHVDEVAIYDRALKANEISRHHDLLRPESKQPAGKRVPQRDLTKSDESRFDRPLLANVVNQGARK